MKNVLKGMIICIILVLVSQEKMISYASETEGDVTGYENVSSDISDLYGYSAFVYSGEEAKEVNELLDAKVTAILLPQTSLTMETNGCVEYFDVIGLLEDGNYVNLSRQISVISCDENIATYDCGRIDAEGVGTTTIYLSYDTYQFSVDVTVEREINWEEYHNALIAELDENNIERKVPGPQLSLVMTKRAGDMMFIEWVAKEDFTMNDGSLKKKGTTIKGVPYSLKNKVYNADGFMEKYKEYTTENDNGFYDILPRQKGNEVVYDAMYGVDCSGFLSFAWGISRHVTADFRSALVNGSNHFVKIGTYSYDGKNYNEEELKTAYLSLTVGDAIVNNGHCRLVSTNDTERKKIIVNEAAGNTPSIHTYSYDTLAEEGYLPFTITEDYFNSFSDNQ